MQITLKAARTNRNLTQDKAAKIIGVSKDTISNWERGKSFPDALMIKKIEEVYEVAYNNIVFLPNNNDLIVKKLNTPFK